MQGAAHVTDQDTTQALEPCRNSRADHGTVSDSKIVKNVVLQNFNLTSLHQHSIFSAGTFD
jgi:hypothetical protein